MVVETRVDGPCKDMRAAWHGTMTLPHVLPVNSGKKPGIGAMKRAMEAAAGHAAAGFGMRMHQAARHGRPVGRDQRYQLNMKPTCEPSRVPLNGGLAWYFSDT